MTFFVSCFFWGFLGNILFSSIIYRFFFDAASVVAANSSVAGDLAWTGLDWTGLDIRTWWMKNNYGNIVVE